MRSTISGDGRLTVSVEGVLIDDPREDEFVVRVEATPINPTDLALLLGPADVTSVIMSDSSEHDLTLTIPQARMATVEGRLGLSWPIVLEGAGTVIAAGPQDKDLEGRVVAKMSGGMLTDFRKVPSRNGRPAEQQRGEGVGMSVSNRG